MDRPAVLVRGPDAPLRPRQGDAPTGQNGRTGADEVRTNLELVAEGANGVGRDPNDLIVVLLQNAFAWRDGDPWPLIRDGLVHQHGTYEAWGEGADTPGHDRLEPAVPSDEDLRLSTPAGPPEGDRDIHLVVRLHYPGMDLDTASRAAELFATDVMPVLKAG